PWQSGAALRARRPTRRGSAANRTGLVRSATGVVTRSRISLGVAARSSRPYGGPQRCRNSKLQARRPATAINPPGYTGGIPGGPLFLSRNLRTALSRIHRPVAAPRCGGSEERGVTDQGGAGYGRAAERDRVAGLFS